MNGPWELSKGHQTHPLLLPAEVAEAVVKATGGRRPLRSQPADASLHEAQGLLAHAHLLQQGAHVRAEHRRRRLGEGGGGGEWK